MQGNKLDDRFVDKAWKEMQLLLDRDMPVVLPEKEKKRRPFLWLFFLFGFITVSFSAGYWYLNSGIEEQEPVPNVQQKQPIASQEKEKIPEVQVLSESELSVKPAPTLSIVSSKQNEWQKSTNTTLINITESSGQENKEINELKPVISSENRNLILPIEQREEVVEKETLLKVDTKSEENSTESIAESVYKREAIAQLNHLPILSTDLLEYQPEPEILGTKPKKKRDIRRALLSTRFGLEGSLITNRFNPADGYAGLVFMEYPLANSKWSFRTGVGYRQHTGGFVLLDDDNFSYDYVNTASNPDISNDPNDPGQVPTGAITSESIQGYRAILKNVYPVNLAYLDIPIKASYRLSNRLRAEGGILLSYQVDRISFKSESYEAAYDLEFADRFLNYPGLASLFGNYRNFQPNALDLNSERASSFGLRRFDVAASLGIRYHLNSKLAVGMSYDQGLVRINNAKSSGNLNQNVKLSASYYFK